MNRKNFTLVEIMIVVAIIGLLAAIAIPSFINARNTSRTKACINNLRQIDGAKEQWAMSNNKGPSDACAMTDVVPTYIKTTPKCPAGPADYVVSAIGTDPTCGNATAGHVLP